MRDYNNLQFELDNEWELIGFLLSTKNVDKPNILILGDNEYSYIPVTRLFNYWQHKDKIDEFLDDMIKEENNSYFLPKNMEHQEKFITGYLKGKCIYLWCKIVSGNKIEVELSPEFTRLAQFKSSMIDNWLIPRVDIPIEGLILTCFELYRKQGFYKRKLLSSERPLIRFNVTHEDYYDVDVQIIPPETLFARTAPIGFIPWVLNNFIDELITLPVYGLVPIEEFKSGNLKTIYYIMNIPLI